MRENLELARRLYDLPDRHASIASSSASGSASTRTGGRARCRSATSSGSAWRGRSCTSPTCWCSTSPRTGSTPPGVVEIRELLRGLSRERGVTVFMSSHILTEVDRLATRIGIIHRGRVLQELERARSWTACRRRRVLRIAGARRRARPSVVLRAARLRARPGARMRKAPASGAHEERALDRPDEIARLLVEGGAPPLRLAVEQEDIEDHFLRLTAAEAGAATMNAFGRALQLRAAEGPALAAAGRGRPRGSRWRP